MGKHLMPFSRGLAPNCSRRASQESCANWHFLSTAGGAEQTGEGEEAVGRIDCVLVRPDASALGKSDPLMLV